MLQMVLSPLTKILACKNEGDDSEGNDSESDDSQGLNDMSGYSLPEAGDDYTLPSQLSQTATGEKSSSTTNQASTKRPRGVKSPSKKSKKAE